MKYLEMHTDEIKFKLELADNVTVVLGDGNTGKTCIYHKLIDAVNEKRIADDFFFINLQSLYDVKLLNQAQKALFVIDDFDSVRIVCPEIKQLLNKSQNQVLLFGRNLSELRVDRHYVYYAKSSGNVITFKPELPVRLH